MPVQEIPAQFADLKRNFRAGVTRPMSWRRAQLKQLKALIRENQQVLSEALNSDLKKSSFEGWVAELGFTINEIDHTLAHLDEWARPETVSTPLAFQPAHSEIRSEPLGVVLIIGPWNYPVQLVLAPLIGALAAGNCAILKPSEIAGACSTAIAQLVPKYMDPQAVRVVEGAVAETQALLELPFDHIFFTGSTAVGRIVMQAAAKHLTPVTLELGGKSPAIVHDDANLKVTARRLVWGKLYNCGQTCVAPDYVLVHESKKDALIAQIRTTLGKFFGADTKASIDYSRIVNERHFDRLVGLLEGQDVALGGGSDRDSLFIEPTVLVDVDPDSPVMQDEIFGPILPVLTYRTLDEAIDFINDRPKPLALYVFTGGRKAREEVLNRTSSGGAAVNQTVLHLAVPDLPFGGVGPSGMGAYHGRSSFETFSHRKAVMNKPTIVDPDLLYPPYTDFKKGVTKRVL